MQEFPHRFVPASADMADWTAISALFDDLDRRSLGVDGVLAERMGLRYRRLVPDAGVVEWQTR